MAGSYEPGCTQWWAWRSCRRSSAGWQPQAERLKGDLSGLVEIVADAAGGTADYTEKLAGRLYVLHVFQEKSTRGIATPKHEVDLIKARLRWARWHHAQLAAGRSPEEG